MDAVIGGMVLSRFHQHPPDAAPVLIPMDGHLPNVKGVGRCLPIQERGNSTPSQVGDKRNAMGDQSAMPFLRLDIVVSDPLQPRPLPKGLAGTALDLWQKGGVASARRSYPYHLRGRRPVGP